MKAFPKIRLVTFADGSLAFRLAAKRLQREATRSEVFDSMEIYNKKKVIAQAGTQSDRYLTMLRRGSKGFGYWSWKPLLIKSELNNKSKDFDFLIYIDAGFTININGKSLQRLLDYCDLAQKQGVMTFHLPGFIEKYWSKKSATDYFQPSLKSLETEQCLAGILVFDRSTSAVNMATRWLEASTFQDFKLINDNLDTKEIPGFRAHRHDQSLWSLTAKSLGVLSIPDETYFEPNWNSEGHNYPFWATRLVGLTRLRNKTKFWAIIFERILKRIP